MSYRIYISHETKRSQSFTVKGDVRAGKAETSALYAFMLDKFPESEGFSITVIKKTSDRSHVTKGLVFRLAVLEVVREHETAGITAAGVATVLGHEVADVRAVLKELCFTDDHDASALLWQKNDEGTSFGRSQRVFAKSDHPLLFENDATLFST